MGSNASGKSRRRPAVTTTSSAGLSATVTAGTSHCNMTLLSDLTASCLSDTVSEECLVSLDLDVDGEVSGTEYSFASRTDSLSIGVKSGLNEMCSHPDMDYSIEVTGSVTLSD